jgi:succinoglycan biosynthesis protein ExoM
MKNKKVPSITVCVCTYKRPEMLANLLAKLDLQESDKKFTYSAVIIDNDREESARPVVSTVAGQVSYKIIYDTVTEPNISVVRNTAVSKAEGDYIAFIDDDEFPGSRWLIDHFNWLEQTGGDGVLGPVLPHFDTKPPAWIIKGGMCDRNRYPSGTLLPWNSTRTGNVLFKRSVFDSNEHWFDEFFGKIGGEDVDFFRRKITEGKRFFWCDEASVHETVPANRLTARYFLKRAWLRGYISFHYFKREMTFSRKVGIFFKSITAMSIYSTLLPLLLLTGFHRFMKYLIKWTDHTSRLLTLLGWSKLSRRTI